LTQHSIIFLIALLTYHVSRQALTAVRVDLTENCLNVVTSNIDDQIICIRTGDVSDMNRGSELKDWHTPQTQYSSSWISL